MTNFNQSVLNEIAIELLNANEKIAVAESVTSGYLQNAFSQMEQATDFFEGGITTYTIESKINLLNVDAEEAARVNCVSQNIAEQMAANAAKLFKTHWSVAITGYASPVPESGFELFAFYSIFYLEKIVSSQKINLSDKLNPLQAQHFYTEKILEELNLQIKTCTNLNHSKSKDKII